MSEITLSLATIYGQIRFILGDNQQDEGLFPGGRNFTDEELHFLYESEGSVGAAAVEAAEILSRSWASTPREEQLGPHRTKSDAARYWAEHAERLRRKYGSAEAPQSFWGKASLSRISDE